MRDPHHKLRRAIENAVIHGPGMLNSSVRARIAERADVPEDLRALVDKVHDNAYRVTPEDLAALRVRYSEDEIFEIVVSAAVGAAKKRLDAGLRALEEA